MRVLFNDYDLSEKGLILTHKSIASPKVKRNTVDIPLRDGTIELTEFLSNRPRFDNRKITMIFEMMRHIWEWESVRSELFADYHGQKVNVSFQDDANYYFEGVCEIGEIDNHGFTSGLTIELDAQPFRRTKEPVIDRDVSIDGNVQEVFEINNMRGYVVITTDSAITVDDGEETFTVTPNMGELYGTILAKGENRLTFYATEPTEINVKIYGGDL